ncbi:hypothetical protein ACPWSR_06660 [Alloiococcus sp. CFN-8]|uniref:hypothetical protein n=1 Tax=Alloiococcus sp. CFN-8 TaxID=3416081 RepID=UPI003CF6EDE8
MRYEVQVGKVAFIIDCPYEIPWKDTDGSFLCINSDAQIYILTSFYMVDVLPDKTGIKVYESEGVEIWQEESSEEIRSYQALFKAGHPVYAQTRFDGEKLVVYYNKLSNVWNNGNMSIWNLLHLENNLLTTGGLPLHCCYMMYKEQAILFTAPSGTGKTTQGTLWNRLYGSQIINGDKCLLQQEGESWLACGFPFHGSAEECENKSYPIRAIVIVRQSQEDAIEELTLAQKTGLLLSECTVNTWNPERVNKALDMLTDLAIRTTVIMLHCTLEDNAARVLHQYLYGGKNDGII